MIPTQMGTAPSPIKRYANWNMCFSCGFNVEDGHTLVTCPMEWQQPNHLVGYMLDDAGSTQNAISTKAWVLMGRGRPHMFVKMYHCSTTMLPLWPWTSQKKHVVVHPMSIAHWYPRFGWHCRYWGHISVCKRKEIGAWQQTPLLWTSMCDVKNPGLPTH